MPNQNTTDWGQWEYLFQDPNLSFEDIAVQTGKPVESVRKKYQRMEAAGKVSHLEADVRTEMLAKQEARDLRSDLTKRDNEILRLQRELQVATRIDAGVRNPPEWTQPAASVKDNEGIVVAQLTDTHFDEVVRPDEVGYINAYNREIAEYRLQRWVEKVIILARDYVQGVDVKGLFIPATGDLLSGDIHEELRNSNADLLYSSADHWIDRLIAAITTFVGEFGNVHVGAVVGNHGRSTLKPVFKGRARSNIEWLMWRQVARHFEKDDRVTVQVSDSMDLVVPIYNTRYLLTHGDQFKGGSGISGAYAPLALGHHRKSMRQAATDEGMDIMVMGHFHQSLWLPGVVVGGSMKGYDEYAYGLNLRPEQAKQAFWVTTPEYGPTIHAEVYLQDRDKEGW